LCHSAAVLSRVRRLRRYVRTNGARRTAAAIVRLLRERIYMDERLIVTVKDLDSIVEHWHESELRVEDMRADHLPELAELNRKRGQPKLQRLFTRYVEQGFHGFVGYSEGELVGYYWWVDRDVPATYTDTQKLGLGIELSEDEVYGSHFFMLEEHRGHGHATDFLYTVESALHERGYARLWGYVVSSNRPARWVYSTRGYTPMWVVRLRRIVFIQQTTRESS
jgi:GNAT superfamily N-acetyltransferase